MYVELFRALTSNDWARGINTRLWSAEMMLHASVSDDATPVVGCAPVVNTATDQSKK